MRLFFNILLLAAIVSSVWVVQVRYAHNMVIDFCDQLVEELLEEEHRPMEEQEASVKHLIAPVSGTFVLMSAYTLARLRKDDLCLTPYLEINNPPPEFA